MSSHKDKIAVLMPTRFRLQLCQRALDSWKANSVASDIILGFQKDDPDLFGYSQMCEKEILPYMAFDNIGMAAKVNELCKAMPGYKGYMVLNDDQIIHTHSWDRKILDAIDAWEHDHGHRFVIPHWRDGIHDERLPQGFMTSEMLEVCGTYYPVGFMRHLFTDNYFLFLGKMLECLKYLPDVYIEHLHFVNGKAPIDANYQQTQTRACYEHDGVAFEEWALRHGYGLVGQIEEKIAEVAHGV